jgi:hypothetical protein
MANYWCVNFDSEAGPLGGMGHDYVLAHGLARRCWMMQYQYAHGGHVYQGHSGQIAATSKNWNVLRRVGVGDWFVAYLPDSRFYAVGEVIAPRDAGQPHQEDTVARTVREHAHRHLTGPVRYSDTPVFYEDFTDAWNLTGANPHSKQTEVWRYPQRIDVREWEYVVASGVRVEGLSTAAPFPRYRDALFEIPRSFFEGVRAALEHAQ